MPAGAQPEHQQQDLTGTAVKMAAGFHVYDMDDSTLRKKTVRNTNEKWSNRFISRCFPLKSSTGQ
jgi:hypothetical protein